MSQKEVWKKYILAQSKILEHKSKPIGIDTSKEIPLDGLKLHLSIDQEIFKQVFKKEVAQTFNIKDFDFNSGYIQTSIENTANITTEKLSKLKELAEICYIDFNENPLVDGIIERQNTPSISSLISAFYRNIEIYQNNNTLTVTGVLHKNIYELFQRNFGLLCIGNSLIFKFENSEDLNREIERLESKGIILPKPKENCLCFNYDNHFYNKHESDLNFEIFRLKRTLEVYFPNNHFEYYYTTEYSFGSGLQKLQESLGIKMPNLKTKLIANGEKLIFQQFYQTGSKTEILARLQNQLEDLINSELFSYIINDTFYEKYLCEENFELKVEQEEEKLSKLLREDFYFGNTKEKFYLGKLRKVDYPELYFVVDEDKLEKVKENIVKETIKAIFPDLKGEKDKIKRLEDTILKLDSKEKLPNDNAKEFLYDSSKAKSIRNIEYLLNKTCSEWQEFEKNLFSKSLNVSQRQAIYKSLYAEELALIQGPPGTGKSTAIAEIIWQHIRKAQKQIILLTSETNLAVDNAIDKLKNQQNNVVKPIRFGKAENLESEGYFYSIEAIVDWQKGNGNLFNTVSHWINNIANRITIQNHELINSALEKWKNHLQIPNSETKNLFVNKYFEYVNLIGATGSSIGKLNSENNWTSFFRSYLNVFEYSNYKTLLEKSNQIKVLKNGNDDLFEDELKKIKREFSTLKSTLEKTEITFDTIIMDEASKATPPELALPVLFGKKSIIVGDHRQLPPMIDGEEIKDLLISIGEKELAKTLSHKEFEISQFERLFNDIDESIKGTFDTQYRMHPAINEVISQFYKNDGEKGLQCGLPLEEVYHNSFEKWDSRYHGLNFKNLITPETHTIWINVTTPEIKEGTSRVNYGEIEAIENILSIIKNCEGKSEFDNWLTNQSQEEKQIGLISFYGKQISYLERMLLQSHNDLYKGKGKDNDKRNFVRLSTVDRFQGMERNIIIVSMVRSNRIAVSQDQQPNYELYGEMGYQKQESLGFAESPNRLNVALSRARRLLIVVGNGDHFCQKPIYKNVFNTIKKNGKIISAEELKYEKEQNG